jgi:hypothetical protein
MSSRAAMMHDSDQNDKSWFQRQKDKLADKKERRAKRKVEERKQRAEQEKQIRVCPGFHFTALELRTNDRRLRSRRTGRNGKSSFEANTPPWAPLLLQDTLLHPWRTDLPWVSVQATATVCLSSLQYWAEYVLIFRLRWRLWQTVRHGLWRLRRLRWWIRLW